MKGRLEWAIYYYYYYYYYCYYYYYYYYFSFAPHGASGFDIASPSEAPVLSFLDPLDIW
jgi:hypothetical protein